MLGQEVKTAMAETKLAAEQGHAIQNHSWSHPDLKVANHARVREELESTQKIIKDAVGTASTRIRPPYGAGGWSPFDPELREVAESLSLKILNWDVDTNDWRPPRGIGPSKVTDVELQLKRRIDRSPLNVLMHVRAETARDLPQQRRTYHPHASFQVVRSNRGVELLHSHRT